MPVLAEACAGSARGWLAAMGTRRDAPSTKIFSTSLDQTSLPSLSSLWCLRCGVRLLGTVTVASARDSMLLLVAEEEREGEREVEKLRRR